MGSGPDFGGKPDSVTAGRSSSQSCRVGANGYRIIDTHGQTRTSQAWVRVFCITIWSWPWAHKIHNLCFTPLLKPWEIPRIPSSWKLKSKITNSSQGHTHVLREERTHWQYSTTVLFLPVSPYETLAGEPEIVLRDTWHVSPHPAGLRCFFCATQKTKTLCLWWMRVIQECGVLPVEVRLVLRERCAGWALDIETCGCVCVKGVEFGGSVGLSVWVCVAHNQ